ncbi:MAG: thioredoxin family protein [Anaerolineales bacterium]|jgi:thioredoxin-like negative regulator of GroEL
MTKKTKKTKQRRRQPSRMPQFFILGGLLVLAAAILVLKEKPQPVALLSNSDMLAEAQLDLALESRQPVLAFFHSNNCQQCLIMVDTVAQVYPQFQDAVALVDIDVYDEQNLALLRRVRLQYIPTLIFFDRNGQAEPYIGVMEASQLSSMLAALSGEP